MRWLGGFKIMSQTYNLVCPETKTAIWCGQRDYLYGGEKLELLAKWLHAHKGKAVFFVNDESELLDDIEYKNWVGMEDDEPPNGPNEQQPQP